MYRTGAVSSFRVVRNVIIRPFSSKSIRQAETRKKFAKKMKKVDEGWKDTTRNMNLLKEETKELVTRQDGPDGETWITNINVSKCKPGTVADIHDKEKKLLHVFGYDKTVKNKPPADLFWTIKLSPDEPKPDIKKGDKTWTITHKKKKDDEEEE